MENNDKPEEEGAHVPYMPKDLVMALAKALGMIWVEMEKASEGAAGKHLGEWHYARVSFLPRAAPDGGLSVLIGGVHVDIIHPGAEHSQLLEHQSKIDGDNFKPPEPPLVSLN